MTHAELIRARRDLLEQEVKRLGLANVARLVGKPDRQLADIIAGRKTFGEKVARDIGPLLRPDLPEGWLVNPGLSLSSNTHPSQESAESRLVENVIPAPDIKGRRWLKPLNPQHPPIMEPFRVLGMVIGKWEDD